MEPVYITRQRLEEQTHYMTAQEFIVGFVKGTLGRKTKHDRWSIIRWGNMDVLQYTHPDNPDLPEHFAYKLQDGSIISNANRLEYIGRKYAWGREVDSRRTRVEEQEWIEDAGSVPIPFTLFKEAMMDVRDFSWVVKPVAEDVMISRPPVYGEGKEWVKEPRHFSGACIFAIDKEMYLFDIDRQEIQEHNIFNPFVTKLSQQVKTILEAYDILMPDEVKKAIADGIDVKRQGEFFFIKCFDTSPIRVELTTEETAILRNPPSRFGYGITENTPRFEYASADRSPFEKDVNLDTPEKKEYQKAALKYKKVADKYAVGLSKPGTLGKSATGSHSVEKYIKLEEDTYASGKISQNRRQHGDIYLTGWYKVVANTGTISWTITGDID
jgi:hypothetical protein